MLNERRASGIHYDVATDVARVLVDAPPGTVRTRTVAADLLLDARGFLVGADVEPEAPRRCVVMLGPHENVARKVSDRVGVCTDASGEVFEVRIEKARVKVRAAEKNPYV